MRQGAVTEAGSGTDADRADACHGHESRVRKGAEWTRVMSRAGVTRQRNVTN